MFRNPLLIMLLILPFAPGFCPTQPAQQLDAELSKHFKTLLISDPDLRCDSLSQLFTKYLLAELNTPPTFDNPLDSFSNLIDIIKSKDNKIKFLITISIEITKTMRRSIACSPRRICCRQKIWQNLSTTPFGAWKTSVNSIERGLIIPEADLTSSW